MKRYLASAFIILIIPFIFPLFVKAESIPNLNDFVYDTFGHYMNNASISEVEFEYSQGKEVLLIRTTSGSGYQILVGQFDLEHSTSSTLFITGQTTRWFMSLSDGMFSVNNKYTYYSNYNYQYGTMTYYPMSNWIPPYDFDNLYYSAQIPVPDIDVFMDSSNPYPTAGDAVWNATVEIGDNSNFYVQWGYKISWPTYIDLGLSGVQGDITYNYYGYLSSPYVDIVSLNSLTNAVAQGASASTFLPMWKSFYEGLKSELSLPEFGSSINAMSTSMINNAKQFYIDYMMTQIPMYGNRLEIFARYFTIDADNGNRVVVGAWNHWNSKDGSRTKERPSNYIDNVALPGNVISNSDPDYQDNSDTFTTNGDSTGTPATIINNNYVPNYPDYPTVATYNHDNILLNFMDTAKQLPSFFGEFTGFLTVAFGFIPSWIWTIIGMGFTFSIVIMIIKVL